MQFKEICSVANVSKYLLGPSFPSVHVIFLVLTLTTFMPLARFINQCCSPWVHNIYALPHVLNRQGNCSIPAHLYENMISCLLMHHYQVRVKLYTPCISHCWNAALIYLFRSIFFSFFLFLKIQFRLSESGRPFSLK